MLSLENRKNKMTVFIAVAAIAASAVLVRRIAHAFIPFGLSRCFSNLHNSSSQLLTVVIDEYRRKDLNQLFKAADSYWGTLVTTSIIRERESGEEKYLIPMIAIDKDHVILDVFRNVQVRWKLVFTKDAMAEQSDTRSYELTFHKENKDTVLNLYLPYVLEKAKPHKEGIQVQKFRLCPRNQWQLDNTFDQSTNFNTLVMDSELKKTVLDDLTTFMSAQKRYTSMGKAWNRRYLLCGAPGTGKSSLITAMANHLNYDIYEVDLTRYVDINYLTHHMVRSKSIILIKLQEQEEDVDETDNCGKTQSMTSLFLQSTDGLWSACSNERIIIFTANDKAMFNSALTGLNRFDMHINMSNYSCSTFKKLVFQHLAVEHHELLEEIEGLLGDIEVTPEEVVGELKKSDGVEVLLRGFVKFLHQKKFKLDEREPEASIKSIEGKE